jgi:hypothetical protein
MRFTKLIVIIGLVLAVLACGPKEGCPTKETVTSAVKNIMPVRFEIVSIAETTQIHGMCEVVIKIDKEPVIFYTDKTGGYFFSGSLVSTKDKTDITQKRREYFKTKLQ